MESAIDILPREVLYNVFSKLCVTERLNASAVCKKWLEILNCKSLLKDITVLINNNNNVPVFASMSRNFLNFSFKLIIVDEKYYELFKRFSSYIEYISFENCEVWKREPITFDDLRYDNLKVLKIIECDLWTLFPCLPNLKELYLTGNSTITDEGIAVLQKTMKHLEVLSLLCPVSCEQKIIRRFYPLPATYETNPSSLILSFPAVFSFVSERANTLRELYLDYTFKALKELLCIKALYLYKLDIYTIYGDDITDIFKNQPKLKSISLRETIQFDENIIDPLCSLLPDIEEIKLQFFRFTGDSLSKLFQLRKLNKLDISVLRSITAVVFNEAVLDFKAYQLKYLNLYKALQDTKEMTFDVLFQQCKYLVYLDISYNEIPDCVVHSISKYLVHLEYLCLKNCGITDYGLTGQKSEPLLLEETDVKVEPLSNLKNLRKLNLSYCNKITDNAIIDTIKFKYLEYLYLYGRKLKLDIVQKLLQQNPSIKKIWNDHGIEKLQ